MISTTFLIGTLCRTLLMAECEPQSSHSFQPSQLLSTFFRNYVDQGTSVDLGLTSASSDSFILRADSTTVLDPSGPGRNSVRIKSKNTYTQHLVVYVS